MDLPPDADPVDVGEEERIWKRKNGEVRKRWRSPLVECRKCGKVVKGIEARSTHEINCNSDGKAGYESEESII